jgi:hypothetical protein
MRRVYPRTFHEAMAPPVRTPCRIVTAALAAVVVIWDQVAEAGAFTAHNAVRFYDTRAPRSFR